MCVCVYNVYNVCVCMCVCVCIMCVYNVCVYNVCVCIMCVYNVCVCVGVHTAEGSVAGARAVKLTQQREQQRADFEARKTQVRLQSAALGRIDANFVSSSSSSSVGSSVGSSAAAVSSAAGGSEKTGE